MRYLHAAGAAFAVVFAIAVGEAPAFAATFPYAIWGQATFEKFSETLVSLGDVNGDGVGDFAVGAPEHDGVAGNLVGRIDVYSGADGSLAWQVEGYEEGIALGLVLDRIGDLNGDGLTDLLVGIRTFDSGPAGNNAGRVQVLSGADGAVLLTIEGHAADVNLGWGVKGLGDRDGDALPDLSAIYRVYQGASGFLEYVRLYSSTDGSTLQTFVGPEPDAGFGAAVAELPDIDGDSVSDLAISATHVELSPGVYGGAVYVYSGVDGSELYAIDDDAQPVILQSSEFGRSLAVVSDYSGDGIPDLAVSERRFADPGTLETVGRLYFYDVVDGSLLFAVTGQSPDNLFGFPTIVLGDTNGDGFPDLGVGAAADPGLGRVLVLSGADLTVLSDFQGYAGTFGFNVAAPGDLNHDGLADLVVGALGMKDQNGDPRGRVYAFNLNGPCPDGDADGFGFPEQGACPFAGVDCDDLDPAIHPGAFDTPGDGIDQNCDGSDAVCGMLPVAGDDSGVSRSAAAATVLLAALALGLAGIRRRVR